jgi:hypothetical protein
MVALGRDVAVPRRLLVLLGLGLGDLAFRLLHGPERLRRWVG